MEMLCIFSVDKRLLWHGAKAGVRVMEELLLQVYLFSGLKKKKKKKKVCEKISATHTVAQSQSQSP
jgi:hypothetical protein